MSTGVSLPSRQAQTCLNLWCSGDLGLCSGNFVSYLGVIFFVFFFCVLISVIFSQILTFQNPALDTLKVPIFPHPTTNQFGTPIFLSFMTSVYILLSFSRTPFPLLRLKEVIYILILKVHQTTVPGNSSAPIQRAPSWDSHTIMMSYHLGSRGRKY